MVGGRAPRTGPVRPSGPEALACWPGPVLGVDVGGSGTRALVLDRGQVVDRLEAGGMNALLDAGVVETLAGLARRAGATAVGVGLPGMRSAADAAATAATLARGLGGTVRVRVVPDGEAARLGAFLGGPGIVVVAGTGSVAVGAGGDGAATAGGHGFLLGDEGGGYWIGREAVRAALRARDGLGPPTRLGEAVTTALGVDLDGLVRVVHTRPTDRGLLAGLVPTVAALPDDREAARILAAAGAALVDLAAALRRRLGALPVAGLGGVFEVQAVRRRFRAGTGAVEAASSPALGAALVAVAGGPDRDPPGAP